MAFMRNYQAMSPAKLNHCILDFEFYMKHGTRRRRDAMDAVYRVIKNGGDIDENYLRALEAQGSEQISRIFES